MLGITLSAEQIQQAPPEVRRWIEQQVAGMFGLSPAAPTLEAPPQRLIACSPEEARVILSLIQSSPPVVGVFFELAREPVAASPQGLRALRLDEMGRHVRLQTTEQVIACLQMIDQALKRASGSPDAAVTALDGAGHCLVADATARSIFSLWQEIVAAHDLAPAEGATMPALPSVASPPFTINPQPAVPPTPVVNQAA